MKKMSKANAISAMILLVMTGCGGGKQSTDDLISVDVTKSYPEKELILQNFMDVEYITLDDADEFITQGVVKDIGKEIILVINRMNDGDIFVFDRSTGKGKRKRTPSIQSYVLVESYEKGELKGRLKEIAAKLNAESNPVMMLAKHKN
jgi:hypothetical protein